MSYAQKATVVPTNTLAIIPELDSGAVEAALGIALSVAAAGSVNTGRKSKVTLELELNPIEGTHQVRVSHKVGFKQPTARGEKTEHEDGVTVLHVNSGGALSLVQADLPGVGSKQSSIDDVA